MTHKQKFIAMAVLAAAASALAGQLVEVPENPVFVSGDPETMTPYIAVPKTVEGSPEGGNETLDLPSDVQCDPAVLIYIDDDCGNKIRVSYWQYLDYLRFKDQPKPYQAWLSSIPPLVVDPDGSVKANPLLGAPNVSTPLRLNAGTGVDTSVALDPRAAMALSEQQGWPTWKTVLVVGTCTVAALALTYLVIDACNNSHHNSDSSKNINVDVHDGNNNNVTIKDGSDEDNSSRTENRTW